MTGRTMEKFGVIYLKQPIVVTNIVGGSGMIGWNELARAKPDGYTIGIVSTGTLLQQLYGKTRYQYSSALEPLIQIATVPMVMAVLAESPWKSANDLVSYAKEHPGDIVYGHSGLGTVPHAVAEMFAQSADIKPFMGDSEALAALLGGHVQVIFTYPPSIKEYVRTGN
jgi:tripartite-type tricarboxylate transporter receptor subunit TctC